MPRGKLKTQNSKLKTAFGVWGFEFGHLKNGFTFIELLVVISLMAIVAASVSAAFLTFERRQRINEAANIVRSNLRLAQNNASSGKTTCASPDKLAGWYVSAVIGDSKISVAGMCKSSTVFSTANVKLPLDMTVSGLSYGSTSISGSSAYIVFRPLAQGATFHTALQFFSGSATDDLTNLFGTLPQDPFTINLSSAGGTSSVIVYPSGEIK